MLGCSEWIRLISSWLLLGVTLIPLGAEPAGAVGKPTELKVVEVKQADGQILSYRHLTGSTEVRMRGTRLAPKASIKLKAQSRPGFVEIDINRGNITGLKPAHQLGKDFLAYVMWAVSVDGRASNLGEITFQGRQPVSINVTTPYQTFWLMVTAEPDYAVVDPSPQVILYSSNQGGASNGAAKKALPVKGNLFFYTHYTTYNSAPGSLEDVPIELLQARKAVELASQSGTLAVERPGGAPGSKEEEHARENLEQAKTFLAEAENAYRTNPKSGDVAQLARTSAQIAENARALAQGAVGGVYTNQLESELARLQAELAKRPKGVSKAPEEPPKTPTVLPPVETKAIETKAPEPPAGIASNPITWFGLIGWALALLLLLRRRSA